MTKPYTLIDKAFLLKQLSIFETVDLDILLAISDKLTTLVYEKPEVVFFEEEMANRMYFIMEGAVHITIGAEFICRLEKRTFFGEESLFSNKPRAYKAEAVENTVLFSLNRSILFPAISENPSIALGFLQEYTACMKFRPYTLESRR